MARRANHSSCDFNGRNLSVSGFFDKYPLRRHSDVVVTDSGEAEILGRFPSRKSVDVITFTTCYARVYFLIAMTTQLFHNPAPEPDPLAMEFEELRRLLDETRQSGAEEALVGLVQRYQDHIRLVARRHLTPQYRQRIDSLDIQQDVLLELVKRIRDGEVELRSEEEFLEYLHQVTVRRLIDTIRGLRRLKRSIDRERRIAVSDESVALRQGEAVQAREASPSSQVALQEAVAVLEQQLSIHLQEDELYLFRRKYLEGAANRDLAAEFDTSEKSIRARLSRIRKQLRGKLRHLGLGDE